MNIVPAKRTRQRDQIVFRYCSSKLQRRLKSKTRRQRYLNELMPIVFLLLHVPFSRPKIMHHVWFVVDSINTQNRYNNYVFSPTLGRVQSVRMLHQILVQSACGVQNLKMVSFTRRFGKRNEMLMWKLLSKCISKNTQYKAMLSEYSSFSFILQRFLEIQTIYVVLIAQVSPNHFKIFC